MYLNVNINEYAVYEKRHSITLSDNWLKPEFFSKIQN